MINYPALADAIRILAVDSIEKAKSGHPGMPMGMAEIGVSLWKNHLHHNPNNPNWINRDRFVLSNGHGSMLLYSLLHLTGYNVTIKDLENFRQLNSKTPGHPEYGYTDGVETTTGPLGQGLANAVGMALVEKLLAHEFNQDSFKIIDHYTYVFVGDGCLMEGISHEVCSLAGTMGLGKLIVVYDSNNISIDGNIDNWFDEDVVKRFEAYNWHVIDNINGHSIKQIDEAFLVAKAEIYKPTLIICKTKIGKGAPNKAGSESIHGAPLGKEETELLRENLSWTLPPFIIPAEIYQQFDCKEKGQQLENAWDQLFVEYTQNFPAKSAELLRRYNHIMPENFTQIIQDAVNLANNEKQTIATRKASQNAITYYAKVIPELVGGSADLTGSNLTNWNLANVAKRSNNFVGNYISFGVREFGMCAILNGMYLHGGIRPFGGTFLMFSEYARNALRMAGLMKIAPIFVFTHDSIGLGEDGPTHQPIEQIATLRLIPNMHIWRPCDTVETMVAWGFALAQTKTPSSLVFSRQNLQFIERNETAINNIKKGGYILRQSAADPEILIIATGSEVELALSVYDKLVGLNGLNKKIQLVSMPSTSVFDQQEKDYKQHVLSNAKFKIAVEAGTPDLWHKYVGIDGLIIGIEQFGESAPANMLFAHFGFTVDAIFNKIEQFIKT